MVGILHAHTRLYTIRPIPTEIVIQNKCILIRISAVYFVGIAFQMMM